ncbi:MULTISPECIES: hypothetical protein [unclassified Rhizobium]|uniref:hypothetical protein n=1 Tax=unclassified Rhizobium TaxID=2613769 RepID=UPI000EAA2444|nr:MULTISPECIES: hypothetical protein [unclassified Rhizobium]AYG68874.1 hypothetical protein CCGE531_22620 [Rhizobium sp. CCGE531]AYG75261.1 hypothetical protein CCGE532_22105 [Rhizobium sp. CCGE532]
MAARDRYSRKLECAKCAHAAFAEVSETDDRRAASRDFKVDDMPRGFSTERPSPDPRKHMMRCRCGSVFPFEQDTAYAPGGEPRR